MKSVSRFEANLIRLVQFILHQAPLQQAHQLLDAKIDRPRCLGRNAIDLVKDTIAKGTVLLLTRAGGWCVERFLRGETSAEGRLWQRTPPDKLGLSFSRNTLDFLAWVTAKKSAEDTTGWQPVADVTLGDLVFLHFAYGQLRTHEHASQLIRKAPWQTHGLVWLSFAEDHGRAETETLPDFTPWTDGVGACILEALQPELADRWTQMEVDKGNLHDWQQMRNVGLGQERVLDAFLKAVEAANRLDLARFLLVTATRVVTRHATPQMWTKSLRQQAPRLADRSDTYRGVLAFLRVLPRLQQWERRARGVGYFDEGYHASQLWKADWERFDGDTLTDRAQNLIRQLDPMRQTEG